MANEKRLIDANALLNWIEECTDENDWIVNQYNADWIWSMIDSAPTVDAVEVVHGKWEDMWDGKYANPRYRCSVCKEKSLYEFGRDALGNWRDKQALTTYCPNCGAKMDGGNEDV